MKKVIQLGCIILSLFFATCSPGFAQVDDEVDTEEIANNLMVGAGLSYGLQIETLGINANAYYLVTEKFRIGGGLTYFFPEDTPGATINWFAIDLEGHYLLHAEEEFNIYGLAGLNILINSINYEGDQDNFSETYVGLNLGAGIEHDTSFADLFGELKIAGIGGDADQLVLSAGLRFDI